MKIEVADYKYKDVLDKGSRPQKKVVAQQVGKVYPLAVSQSTDVVPDIYQVAKIQDGWIELATDLKKGERVRVIDGKVKSVVEVLEVKDGKFRVEPAEGAARSGEIFVYGREVKDFMTVDYDALAMLNLSATQELSRKVQKLEAELAEKNQRISAMEAGFEARLLAIEKRLGKGDGELQPVSLQSQSGSR